MYWYIMTLVRSLYFLVHMGWGQFCHTSLLMKSEKPIGYASRTLSAAEKNYFQIEKEGLACVFGVKKCLVDYYTDHKPLIISG